MANNPLTLHQFIQALWFVQPCYLFKKITYYTIFASQVSDSLALIYPLADLVGFSKPSQ